MTQYFTWKSLLPCFVAISLMAQTIQANRLKKTLTMQEVVEQTLKHKPSIQAYHYNIESFKKQRKGAFSSFLPNITLNDTSYDAKQKCNIKNTLGLQASQKLFDISSKFRYNMLDSSVSSAKHQKEAHLDSTQLEIETIFLEAWLLQQKFALMKNLFKSSKETFDKAKHSYNLQLLDKNDWLKANAEHAKNLKIISQFKDDIAQYEKALEYYTGYNIVLLSNSTEFLPDEPDGTTLEWNPNEELSKESSEFYYKQALENRKDIKLKQDSIELEQHTSSYHTSQYLPNVSIFGNATKTYFHNTNSTYAKEAGIQLSWNIADGLSNYFERDAAKARKMKAILEKQDLQAKIKFEVEQAHSAFEKTLKELESEAITYHQSENEYQLKKQQTSLGLLSNVDLENATFSYKNAYFSWITQTIAAKIKERELLYTCGYPQKTVFLA